MLRKLLAFMIVLIFVHRAVAVEQKQPACNPPEPPLDMKAVRKQLETLFPKTKDGKPILISNGPIGLAVDFDKDDAISRWGACLSRVEALMKTNKPSMLAQCIDLIEVCPDNTGGAACCPPACITDFKKQIVSGANVEKAIDESFMKGDCVSGFSKLAAPMRAEEAKTDLERAAGDGNVKEVKQLAQSGVDINAICGDSFTPLTYAIMRNNLSGAEALVSLHVDVNRADSWGETPLIKSSAYGRLEILHLLISAGANVNQAGKDGVTPLISGAHAGHADIVQALIDAKANWNLRDRFGRTPLQAGQAHPDVVKILKSAGAR